MNIMAEKETIINDINKFIQSKKVNDFMVLFNHLCDLKELKDKAIVVESISSNPILLSTIIDPTLITLEREYKINRIIDKNNILITVF